MGSYLNNTYLIKAYSAYPYDLEETVENLNYALSYDPNDARSYMLKGLICLRNFKDYPAAIENFSEAIANDLDLVTAYPHLAEAHRLNGEYVKALETLEFALKLPGTDKSLLYFITARVLENKGNLSLAKAMLKEAKARVQDWELNAKIDEAKSRIKAKLKSMRKRRKSKLPKSKRKAK
jgi:tetratricopeptide (TPR) repeat protein